MPLVRSGRRSEVPESLLDLCLAPIPSENEYETWKSSPSVSTATSSTVSSSLPSIDSIVPGRRTKSHARRQPVGHIKRPRNAFILYRSWIVSQNLIPETIERDHRNISCIVADCWKALTPAEREPWQELAREEKRQHEETYPTYKYIPGVRKEPVGRRKSSRDGSFEEKRCKEVARLLIAGREGEQLEEAVAKIDEKLGRNSKGKAKGTRLRPPRSVRTPTATASEPASEPVPSASPTLREEQPSEFPEIVPDMPLDTDSHSALPTIYSDTTSPPSPTQTYTYSSNLPEPIVGLRTSPLTPSDFLFFNPFESSAEVSLGYPDETPACTQDEEPTLTPVRTEELDLESFVHWL